MHISVRRMPSADFCSCKCFTVWPAVLPPTKEEVGLLCFRPHARARLSVCLYVCLCARLLKKACMDLDEMLRVDRCRDTDELIPEPHAT